MSDNVTVSIEHVLYDADMDGMTTMVQATFRQDEAIFVPHCTNVYQW
jgi:hypothetical protein